MWTDRQMNVQKGGGTIRKRDVTYLMSPVANFAHTPYYSNNNNNQGTKPR